MLFHPWRQALRAAFPRRRAIGVRPRCPCQQSAGHKLSLEVLEDRTVPSGAPVPIPGLLFPTVPGGNPFGGPAIHFDLPGPADNTAPGFVDVGGEPSTLTNFNGFIGVAHLQGTGTDTAFGPAFTDLDVRFMTGVFRFSDGSINKGTFAFV